MDSDHAWASSAASNRLSHLLISQASPTNHTPSPSHFHHFTPLLDAVAPIQLPNLPRVLITNETPLEGVMITPETGRMPRAPRHGPDMACCPGTAPSVAQSHWPSSWWPSYRDTLIHSPAAPISTPTRTPQSLTISITRKPRLFWCLALDHKVMDCYDPVKCATCLSFGHCRWACPDSSPHANPRCHFAIPDHRLLYFRMSAFRRADLRRGRPRSMPYPQLTMLSPGGAFTVTNRQAGTLPESSATEARHALATLHQTVATITPAPSGASTPPPPSANPQISLLALRSSESSNNDDGPVD